MRIEPEFALRAMLRAMKTPRGVPEYPAGPVGLARRLHHDLVVPFHDRKLSLWAIELRADVAGAVSRQRAGFAVCHPCALV